MHVYVTYIYMCVCVFKIMYVSTHTHTHTHTHTYTHTHTHTHLYTYTPANKTGSWGIIAILVRTSSSPMVARSTPSSKIFPSKISVIRKRATANVVFPAPYENSQKSAPYYISYMNSLYRETFEK